MLNNLVIKLNKAEGSCFRWYLSGDSSVEQPLSHRHIFFFSHVDITQHINTAALKQQFSCNIKWRCPLCLCAAGEKCGAPCTTEQFTCGNGCCLDPGLECDSTPQCSDKSDEQECDKRKQQLCQLGFIFTLAHGVLPDMTCLHDTDTMFPQKTY